MVKFYTEVLTLLKNGVLAINGYICQRWDVNYPNVPRVFPNTTNHNYCRNPDNDPLGPWCYVISKSKTYDYCRQIALCNSDGTEEATTRPDLKLLRNNDKK